MSNASLTSLLTLALGASTALASAQNVAATSNVIAADETIIPSCVWNAENILDETIR